ncbi:hypothetical protein CDV31_014139 [Fusarium ambrosium]|uniref:Uncharacterized protein n=1 Tax=Fusarium ambrosium TaxID=131363 RepID=A0A428SYH8_9HYPO|nr:hypothetical protein CDV31_014139 [Fusarium ambrosium]
MSLNPNFYVRPEFIKLGHWVNWNGSPASGGQITLPENDADLLNIFIGIFLTMVSAAFWAILACCFFWSRHVSSRNDPARRDGLYHQQQATIQNIRDPIAVSMALIELCFAWRGVAQRASRRSWSMILASSLTSGIFVLALPFIVALPMLDKIGNEVLINSPDCGFWAASIMDDPITGSTDLTNRTWEAVSYVDNCYNSEARSSLCDDFLIRRSLPALDATISECPSSPGMCLSQDRIPAFQMQTEVLDSHKDFGINAPPPERVVFRRVTTCSPLNVADFTEVTEGDLPEEEMTGVYYGETINHQPTYQVSNYKIKAEPHYTLKAFWHKVENGTTSSSTFKAISDLRRSDADVTVILLNNNLIPVQGQGDRPCRDPFFSATERRLASGYYMPDDPITAIGCIDQYAFANPVLNQWTELMAIGDTFNASQIISKIRLSKRQVPSFSMLLFALERAGGIDSVITALGAEALLAKKYPGLLAGYQNPLPDDQWKNEVRYWFNIGLAKLQLQLINIATGPPDTTLPGLINMLPVLSAGQDDTVKIVCSSQKIRNVEFKNYHSSGLISLVVIGGVLILVTSIVPSFPRMRNNNTARYWVSYGMRELLRMATIGGGVQGWTRRRGVPILNPATIPVGDIRITRVNPLDIDWNMSSVPYHL